MEHFAASFTFSSPPVLLPVFPLAPPPPPLIAISLLSFQATLVVNECRKNTFRLPSKRRLSPFATLCRNHFCLIQFGGPAHALSAYSVSFPDVMALQRNLLTIMGIMSLAATYLKYQLVDIFPILEPRISLKPKK